MKSLPALAFIAALAAFVLLPINFAVAGSILFGAGLATIAFSDYARIARPTYARRIAVGAMRSERLGLAA